MEGAGSNRSYWWRGDPGKLAETNRTAIAIVRSVSHSVGWSVTTKQAGWQFRMFGFGQTLCCR